MAKYAQIGNRFFSVGDQSQLQEISASDIIGSRGTVNGGSATLDFIRREGDLVTLDPSQITIGPGNELLVGGRPLSLGGSQAFVSNQPLAQYLSGLGAKSQATQFPISGEIPRDVSFQRYLTETGQTFTPEARFSGSAQVPSPNELPKVIKDTLDSLHTQGYVINPRANLDDPGVAAEFLKRAEAEVSPAYQAQFRLARENILRSIGYDLEGIGLFEKNLEQRYGEQLRGIGEEAAERGFALGGRRVETERQLAEQTQQQLNEKRRQLGFQAGGEALGFLQQYGTQPVGGFGGLSTLPQRTLEGTPQVQAGVARFTRPGTQQPFYSLSEDVLSGIVGTQQKQRQLDIEDLAQAYRTETALGRTIPS